ncbi:electron transfer flavoprotein alpha-subunit [Aeropyrum pernix K1]|uniref:Electron transfer flavoprotein alpha-subunit n=1 Tax=Aeropyrum pernix (strain ATCC 700893 / DSM 11879 / JCM 9820 / NBRC 100138 / K1) TaxID=272557 RepID=Q9Y966_AERPE|nr:electron transfer flavoprotein subunit alpha/FixB family protein [Aeropyrum pernix]BAA81434.1 electron transfer flavoprotein alpha-subunit [Aeropyrum pernix K1]
MGRVECEKICSLWPCEQPEEFRNVWVVAELDEQGVSEASLQMLTPARRIADKLGESVVGVIAGPPGSSQLAVEMVERGADEVIVVEHERLSEYYPDVVGSVIVELSLKYKPSVILFAATARGREMAPYVANTLKTGITADCTDFDVDPKTRDVLLIRPPFSAIMLAYIRTPFRRPQIGTARPNVFPLPERQPGRQGRIVREEVEPPEPMARLVNRVRIPRSEVPIEKAEVIVSGGRGLGTPEGFRVLEELASLLGGVIAGSRKAVDAGWIPPERQVGQTGKSVKPILYIAVGISGSAQHMVGVREARRIVAINIDENAPIIRQADYSLIADYREVIPALIEELRRLKEERSRYLEELLGPEALRTAPQGGGS